LRKEEGIKRRRFDEFSRLVDFQIQTPSFNSLITAAYFRYSIRPIKVFLGMSYYIEDVF
jgi:hypothetical protein